MLEGLKGGRPAFLASVRTADEALAALAGGADVIDGKEPASGALGALPAETLSQIVAAVAARVPVSATVGDLPLEPRTIVAAAEATAATGVDVVKIGFFGRNDARSSIAALAQADIGPARLVAVLMADLEPDLDVLEHLAAAGFAGVMFDTALKDGRTLRDHMSGAQLRAFVARARRNGLLAGLAGSLSRADVAPLASLGPDLIGLRGALCDGGRAQDLDAARVALVRREFDSAISAAKTAERTLA